MVADCLQKQPVGEPVVAGAANRAGGRVRRNAGVGGAAVDRNRDNLALRAYLAPDSEVVAVDRNRDNLAIRRKVGP